MLLSLQLRSDRVIAICRLVIAATLIVASLLDPRYPIMDGTAGASLLWGYLAGSAVALVIAYTDWWLTHRIRLATFAIDAITAFAALYLIESAGLGLVSPFMGFFVFLVLASTLIWQPRTAAVVAAGLIALHGVVGLLLAHNQLLADGYWFVRRTAFMLILAGLLIWYGYSRNPDKPARLDWPQDAPTDRRFEIIVDYLQRHTRASGVAIFWAPADEPWTYLGLSGIAGHRAQRLAPGTVDWESGPAATAILFDRHRQRRLHLEDDGRITARRGPASINGADYLEIETGMLIPIDAETGSGVILLTGIRGLSADHLSTGQALGQEIGMAIDRQALVDVSHAAELARLRLSMARDLHDSVAQSLAGVGFRLTALNQVWRAGGDIGPGLEALQSALGLEQRNVQDMISRLRAGDGLLSHGRVLDSLATTLGNAERRWGIGTALDCSCPDATVSAFLLREIQQLINEAIANAVRHGGARQVNLTVREADGCLQLAVANSRGADMQADFVPQSISERVEVLGGTLAIKVENDHTVVQVSLPTAKDL